MNTDSLTADVVTKPSVSRKKGRFLPILVVVLYTAFTLAVAHGSLNLQGLILVAAVFGILALSLDLVAGAVGLYSLGHAGLFAVGAYLTTLLANVLNVNVFLLLPLSIVVTGLVGLVLGAISLRVSGLYFAITTFVFTLVVTVLTTDLQLTGGSQGLVGPLFPNFPTSLSFLGQSVVWAIMLALLLTLGVVSSVRRSPLYPVLLVIRDAEPYAQASGIRPSLMKVGIFGLSAAMTGLAGWAFTFLGVVSPGQFNWTVSVNILVMVLLGGINTIIGPLLGAAFVTMFPDLTNMNPWWQEIIFGALFVVVITLFPDGAVGIGKRIWRGITKQSNSLVPGHATEVLESTKEVNTGPGLPLQAFVQPGTKHRQMNPDQPAVECRDIVFRYDNGPIVLNHVDLVVKPGTIHGLIGPNGSGKSTLVNVIAGRMRPVSGSIRVKGHAVEHLGPAHRARYGMRRTFQAAELVQELTVCDNVQVGLYSQVPRITARALIWPFLPSARRDSRWMRSRAESALKVVGADDWMHRLIGDVPHGIEQLTQLASVYVAEPDIIILDEPATGLSAKEVDHLAKILSDLKASGITMIVIEHQTRFLFPLCDEVTVLNAGEVIASGTPDEVRADPLVRQVYLGE
ncbi:MAG: ATP-binding cassette domain-containing protein [Alicyclobacillus sp.]|nr:ATP-binding cassette domain-containing protein [Alicyclobacillus sp.]